MKGREEREAAAVGFRVDGFDFAGSWMVGRYCGCCCYFETRSWWFVKTAAVTNGDGGVLLPIYRDRKEKGHMGSPKVLSSS